MCSDPYTARMAKEHNDANVIAFGARVIGIETAKCIVDEWLNAKFEGRKTCHKSGHDHGRGKEKS